MTPRPMLLNCRRSHFLPLPCPRPLLVKEAVKEAIKDILLENLPETPETKAIKEAVKEAAKEAVREVTGTLDIENSGVVQ